MAILREKLRDIDFVGNWRLWFSISAVLLLLGAGALALKGLNLGTDFTGGAEFTVTEPEGPVSEQEVREALPDDVAPEATIVSLGEGGYEVSMPPVETSESTDIRNTLSEELGAEVSATSVSPTFGGQVLTQALQALGAALLVITVFVSYRFQFAFALAALAALLHDILITVGFYALIGREVNSITVIALLTILGYSLYDTIIIFDRIRENVPDEGYERGRFERVANASIRQVVRRSLYTSLSTLIPLVALLIFGRGTLTDFAVALIVGVVAGTYSSLFIASPILALYKAWQGDRPQRQDDVEPGQV